MNPKPTDGERPQKKYEPPVSMHAQALEPVPLQLTEECTLIVPVPMEVHEPELQLGRVLMRAKREHHLTVFGHGVGKLLRRAIEAEQSLRERIDERAAAFDWTVTPLPRFYHLARTKPNGEVLQTVVVVVRAKTALFLEDVRHMLPPPASSFEGLDELDAMLAAPPLDHVTLYTTDPDGLAGIGLHSRGELDEAVRRGIAGDASSLAAFVLAPGVLPLV